MQTPCASVVGSVHRPIISSKLAHLLYPFNYHNSCARTMQTCYGSRSLSNSGQIEPASWLAAGLAPRWRESPPQHDASVTASHPAFRNRDYRGLPSQFGVGRIAFVSPSPFPQSVVNQLVTSPIRDAAVRFHLAHRPAFPPSRFASTIRTTNSLPPALSYS